MELYYVICRDRRSIQVCNTTQWKYSTTSFSLTVRPDLLSSEICTWSMKSISSQCAVIWSLSVFYYNIRCFWFSAHYCLDSILMMLMFIVELKRNTWYTVGYSFTYSIRSRYVCGTDVLCESRIAEENRLQLCDDAVSCAASSLDRTESSGKQGYVGTDTTNNEL